MAVTFVDNEYSAKQPGFRRVLDALADIWDKYGFSETMGPITACHMGWYRAAQALKQLREARRFNHMLSGDEYRMTLQNIIPIQLWFVDEEPDEDDVDDGVYVCLKTAPDTYEIPEFIRSITQLQDTLVSPTYTLKAGLGDFTVNSEVLGGYKGTIEFGTVTCARKMWATPYREKKAEEMVARFGPELGYNTTMFSEYRTYYDLLMLRYVLLNGPTIRGLELAFTITQGWPYTTMASKLVTIGSDSFTLENYPSGTMQVVIPNPTELESKYITNTRLALGIPLVDAVRVYDRKNYPNLADDFLLGKCGQYHKGIVSINGDLAITGDLLGFSTPPAAAFIVTERVVGQTSGAFGYVREVNTDSLRLYGVVGTFVDGETILGNVAGNAVVDFTNGELDPEYLFDRDKYNDFKEKTERYGSDLDLRFTLDFRPGDTTTFTSFALPLSPPESDVFTDGMATISPPESTLFTDMGVSPPSPAAWADTSFSIAPPVPSLTDQITSFGDGIEPPGTVGIECTHAGILAYRSCLSPFKEGTILTGGSSGATGLIAIDNAAGITGKLTLINVHGLFEVGEVITDEITGTAVVSSVLSR